MTGIWMGNVKHLSNDNILPVNIFILYEKHNIITKHKQIIFNKMHRYVNEGEGGGQEDTKNQINVLHLACKYLLSVSNKMFLTFKSYKHPLSSETRLSVICLCPVFVLSFSKWVPYVLSFHKCLVFETCCPFSQIRQDKQTHILRKNISCLVLVPKTYVEKTYVEKTEDMFVSQQCKPAM